MYCTSCLLKYMFLKFCYLAYCNFGNFRENFIFAKSVKKVRKRAKIRNRDNQAPHLTQNTNGKMTTSKLDITNESQEVSPFPAVDHKASINRRTRNHNKNKTKITQMIPKRSIALERSLKYITGGLKPVSRRTILILSSDVDQDT